MYPSNIYSYNCPVGGSVPGLSPCVQAVGGYPPLLPGLCGGYMPPNQYPVLNPHGSYTDSSALHRAVYGTSMHPMDPAHPRWKGGSYPDPRTVWPTQGRAPNPPQQLRAPTPPPTPPPTGSWDAVEALCWWLCGREYPHSNYERLRCYSSCLKAARELSAGPGQHPQPSVSPTGVSGRPTARMPDHFQWCYRQCYEWGLAQSKKTGTHAGPWINQCLQRCSELAWPTPGAGRRPTRRPGAHTRQLSTSRAAPIAGAQRIVPMAEVEAANLRGPSSGARISNDCISVCPKHLTPEQCKSGGSAYTCCKHSDGYYWCTKQACIAGVGCDIQVTWRPGLDPEPATERRPQGLAQQTPSPVPVPIPSPRAPLDPRGRSLTPSAVPAPRAPSLTPSAVPATKPTAPPPVPVRPSAPGPAQLSASRSRNATAPVANRAYRYL